VPYYNNPGAEPFPPNRWNFLFCLSFFQSHTARPFSRRRNLQFRILLPDLCVSERSAVPEFLRAKKADSHPEKMHIVKLPFLHGLSAQKKADSHPEKMHIIKTTVPSRIICAKKRLPFADLLP
jgi:hypothetical protein